MKLNVIGLIENMSYVECPCCQEKTPLFANSGASELAFSNGIEYFGELPFNQVRQNIYCESFVYKVLISWEKKDLCRHIDSEEGTEETELIQIFESFVEKFLKKILVE